MSWSLVFIRRGRQKIIEKPKIRQVISRAAPVPIFYKERNCREILTEIPLSHLIVSGFTDDPVPVKCDAHDGEGGHVDPQTGQDLDQSDQQCLVISSSSQLTEGDITCTLRRTRLREASAARARPWRWGAWWGRPGGQTPPSWSLGCSCKIEKINRLSQLWRWLTGSYFGKKEQNIS